MFASIFRIDLRSISSSRERSRTARSLARSLGALGGFVAFIALEEEEGDVSGLYICEDLSTLREAERLAARWQGEQLGMPEPGFQLVSTGKVIVQQDL